MPQINLVNLQSINYGTFCQESPSIIYVNPVNADEMELLSQNVVKGDMCQNNFLLTECKTRPCLCHPRPSECENGLSWDSFANDQYQDLTSPFPYASRSVALLYLVDRIIPGRDPHTLDYTRMITNMNEKLAKYYQYVK